MITEAEVGEQRARVALRSIGLKEDEVAVVEALLTGVKRASEIASVVGFKRGKTYAVLDALTERGLVQQQPNDNGTNYILEPPSTFEQYAKEMIRQVEAATPILHETMSTLAETAGKKKKQPGIRFYDGLVGVRHARNELLIAQPKTVKIIRSTSEEIIENSIIQHIKERQQAGIQTKLISERVSKDYVEKDKNLERERRVLPSGKYKFPAEVEIYDNRVVFYCLAGRLYSVVVDSEDVAGSVRQMFDVLWEQLPSPEEVLRERK